MEIVKISYELFNRIVCNPQIDCCPVCDTPLKEVCYDWSDFHGEGIASCCHASYQIKKCYIAPYSDPTGELREFMENLNGKNRIECKVDQILIPFLRIAMLELKVRFIDDENVVEKAKELYNKTILGVNVESDELKLYVWEGVLADYTSGVMFALAHSPQEAREAILRKYSEIEYLKMKNGEEFYSGLVWKECQPDPYIVTEVEGFLAWGGS